MQSIQSSKFLTSCKVCDLSKELKFGVIGVAAVGYIAYQSVRKYQDWQVQKDFRRRIRDRQQHRQENIDSLISRISENGVLVTPERQEILNLPPEELVKKIKNGEKKAIEVLRAYQAKAIEATRRTNCVVIFLTEAEDWAKAIDLLPLDADLPLRGLPVSIKEDFKITGYDNTVGYARFLGDKQSKDSVIVSGLKRLGAIPFCRTNIVQTLLGYSASNPIYGPTLHPTHPDRCPGGSSGGEGALIALGGSPLGIGDDIGGSVRIPAHFSGIASIKPTTGRIISTGQFPALPGIQGMCNSPGIMARNVDTIVLGAKSLFSTNILHQIDPRSLPIPWNNELKSKLRIGYYDSSNVFPALPGCKRAVHAAVEALRSSGHTLVKIPCPDSYDTVQRMDQLFNADGGKFLLEKWENDTVEIAQQPLYDSLTAPAWYKNTVLKWYLQKYAKRSAFITNAIAGHELWSLMMDREAMRDSVLDAWQLEKLDAVIAPGFGFPAIPAEHTCPLFTAVTYTMLYNHLDFPAGTVPVTRESEMDQKLIQYYDTMGDMTLELAKKVVLGGEGLPIGVQVISYPWREEVVLRVMKEIQDSLQEPFVFE